jgi:hypothetical protein
MGTTDQARNHRVSDIPLLLMALFSGAAVASAIGLFVVTDIRRRKETPDRIASCHAQRGTARLDRRGVYRGCLVPPKAAR